MLLKGQAGECYLKDKLGWGVLNDKDKSWLAAPGFQFNHFTFLELRAQLARRNRQLLLFQSHFEPLSLAAAALNERKDNISL